MKFKITSKKDTGDTVVHFFDNQTLDIWTEEGIPVVLSEDPRCQELITQKEVRSFKDQLQRKAEEVDSIRITLGYSCNFHCKYCYEVDKGKTAKDALIIHEDLDSKAKRIVEQVSRNLPNLRFITFWGGEPLVYLKLIKKLVPLFREHYPEITYSLITNGSLLSVEVAKYLIDNKIHVTISHDGPAFKTYRNDEDPLDNEKSLEGIRYLMKKDPRTSFNVVVVPENADLQTIVPFFEEKLKVPFNMHFESIVKLTEQTKDIVTPFDAHTSQVLLNNLVAFGSTQNADHDYGCVRDTVTGILRYIINKQPIPEIGCMIGGKQFLAIDINGNLLACHGSNYIYGTLNDVDNAVLKPAHSWKERKDCPSCPFLVSCKGECAIQEDKDHEAVCMTSKIWHAGYFIAAWKILFNSTICRIEPAGD